MSDPVGRVGGIVIDCSDVDTLVGFWAAVLGVEVTRRHPGFVWLAPVTPGGPTLAFQQVPEKKSVKNRVHLDVHAQDREAAVAAIEALGGTRVADHEIGSFHWTVVADPEGNEFCVVPAS